MRYINILSEITVVALNGEPVKGPDGKEVKCSHAEFLLSKLAHQSFTGDIESMARGIALRLIFLSIIKKPVKCQAVEEEDWKKLCVSLKDGSRMNPDLAHNFYEYAKAGLEASEKDPKDKKAIER